MENKPAEDFVYRSWVDSKIVPKGFLSNAQSNIVTAIRLARVRESGLALGKKL